MATTPVLVPVESRSTGHGAETLQFQRLERVRAQRRVHRRRRLLVVAPLVIALAGVLGFTIVRRASFDRLDFPGAPAPNPADALPAAPSSAFGPPSAGVPPPARPDAVQRTATEPGRIELKANRRARLLPGSQDRGAVTPSGDEPQDTGAVDPTAAIDWLLKTSRTRSH